MSLSNEARLVKFFIEQQNRLSCIIRYNNTPKVNGESVAEHSFYVSLMVMLVCDYLNATRTIQVHTETAIRMALLHDVEEIISGDIIKVLKTAGFKEELERMNERSMEYLVGDLPMGLHADYLQTWRQTKDGQCAESHIVDFCDWLAVIVYSIKEIHLGNEYFREILVYALQHFDDYAHGIAELKPLVAEMANYAKRYLLKDNDIIDSINKAVRL